MFGGFDHRGGTIIDSPFVVYLYYITYDKNRKGAVA